MSIYKGENLIAGKALPTQAGQAGKYLTTDGSVASWATIQQAPSTDNETISLNSDNELQAIGIKDNRDSATLKYWTGTKAQFEAITTKDDNTIYTITDDEGEGTLTVGFNNLTGQPTDNTNLATALNGKQATLVSGTNIKTINNNSILGSGNVDIDALPSQSGQSGKYLTTNGANARWGVIDLSLSNLSDAHISAPLNDQVLKYNSTLNKWENGSAGYHPPLLSSMWSDHLLSHLSWLRADTFSWQNGNTYSTVYNELLTEYNNATVTYYAYQSILETERYLKSTTLAVGAQVYKLQSGNMVLAGTIGEIEGNYFYISGEGVGDTGPYGRDPSNDTILPATETEGSITFRRTAKGYKIADATQETAILNKYNTNGIAWYYILDTANTQFKLPRTKFGFEGLRTNVGDDIAESLPNITGEVTGFRWEDVASASAPFALNSNGGATGYVSGSNGPRGINFDASLSSSTYQDNAPVQERATQMYLYFYVGEYSQTAIEQTAGITSEQLNNKLDANHGNDTKPYLKTTYVNGTSGYRIWSDGYCEQWGRATTGAIAPITITFIKTFNDTNYIALTGIGGTGSVNNNSYVIENLARTTSSMQICNYNSGPGDNNYYEWKASGYLAEGEY